MCLQYKSSENTVVKGEIAHDKQFFLFQQCFLPFWRTICHFHQIQNRQLQRSLSLEESNICQLEKRLTHSHTMTPFDTPGKQAF